MSEYQEQRTIRAEAEQVFRFLSSIDAIPQYLPWIREIRAEEDDHVFAVAEERGQRRELSGFFRVSPALRRIDWGSDGTPEYRGWLEVSGAEENSAELTVHLALEGTRRKNLEPELRRALDRIQEALEQQGAGDIIDQQRRVA